MLLLVPIVLIACMFAGGAIFRDKGLEWGNGAGLGCLLGPLGILIALAYPAASPAVLEAAQIASGGRKCPHCAEIVKADAIVCRFCTRDLAPLAKQESTAPGV